MKAYRVVTKMHQGDTNQYVYFTSKGKALGYIYHLLEKEGGFAGVERQADGRWWNGNWCYDVDKLFNIRNWDRYDYIGKGGIFSYHIDMITIV